MARQQLSCSAGQRAVDEVADQAHLGQRPRPRPLRRRGSRDNLPQCLTITNKSPKDHKMRDLRTNRRKE